MPSLLIRCFGVKCLLGESAEAHYRAAGTGLRESHFQNKSRV